MNSILIPTNTQNYIILACAISSLTLSNDKLNAYNNCYDCMPTENYNIENSFTPNYSISNPSLTAESEYISKDYEDFAVLENFAKRMLEDVPVIDENIQKVINENFWDML